MITADAIEDALNQADMREVERAFRALVAFPQGEGIGGDVTAEQLDGLLGRVVRALQLDQSPVPAAVREAIEKRLAMLDMVRDRLSLPVPLHPRVSYGDAALLVQRYHDRWRAVFVAHLGGEN